MSFHVDADRTDLESFENVGQKFDVSYGHHICFINQASFIFSLHFMRLAICRLLCLSQLESSSLLSHVSALVPMQFAVIANRGFAGR